jgi:antitoxin HicB
MKVYNYTVIFEPVEEGGYNVVVPAIPEICTFGETLKEARMMAEDAIRCYLESALREGEPIPEDIVSADLLLGRDRHARRYKEPSLERIAVRV